jgi:hypothetical protein
MSSRNCPLKLQALIATQSQTLLDLEVARRQPLAPTVPTTTISITALIPAFIPVSPLLGSQVSINIQPSPPRPSPQNQPQLLKQLSPNRPEVLMQVYLAEKTAWLAQHPTVWPTEYRKARKWKTPRPKVLKEQAFYLPKERQDLNGNIIATKANWTPEEITVWLDNEERREEEEYNRLELEFTRNGNRFTKNGSREIWGRVAEEQARESERYIL